MAMDRTTVQVRKDLLPLLEDAKRELKAASYDETIRRLLEEHRRLPESLFGRFPKLPAFRREARDRFD